jgi:hypothetical protein
MHMREAIAKRRTLRVVGAGAAVMILAASASAPALAQAGGGWTLGTRNDLGPRYEPYPERMWESYARTGTCPPVTVRTRDRNGKVVVRRVPWDPRACGFNALE